RALMNGAGIRRPEVDHPELRIDARRLPDRGAAVLPDVDVLGPCLVPELARTGNRPEPPDEIAGLGVVGIDAAARAEHAARRANINQSVEIARRARDRVALGRVRDLL